MILLILLTCLGLRFSLIYKESLIECGISPDTQTERDTSNILRPFDKKIPLSGIV
jgi:hypothetical protein